MSKNKPASLSRRERQIMDLVYEAGQCSAREVQAGLPDAPSYSSVRTLLGILVEKGHLQHEAQGSRYVYSATRPIEEAQRGAVQRLLKTFFRGSAHDAVNSLIGPDGANLSEEELDSLSKLIDRARRKPR